MSRHLPLIIFAACGLFFAAFFVFPILHTLGSAFVDVNGRLTIDYIIEVFRNPLYLEGLYNAFRMAFFSTLLAILLAMPLAIVANRYKFPGKALLTSAILVPLILPPFVGAIGIKQLLGQAGSLNALLIHLGLMDPAAPIDWIGQAQMSGIVIMNALHLYPIVYLNLTAALANIDPAMEEAAENLGSSLLTRLRRITLPLVMPGLFAGSTIVFIWSFTELGVPLIFDYERITPVQIFHGIKDLSDNPFPYALVAVMLVSTVILYLIGKRLFGRAAFAGAGRATMARQERELPAVRGLICTGLFVGVTLLAVVPHAGVILLATATDWYGTVLPESLTLRHFEDALGHPLTVSSIGNSLKYAFFATVVDIVLGVAIAWVVVRTRIPGRGVLDAMAMLPLAVPGLVLAFGFLAMTREGQPFDWLMIGEDPVLVLIIAYAVRRLPYVVRSAAAGFQQTSVTLEEAAQNLGASPARTLRRITLPLIVANLIAGGLLAFSFAMLEVSDSLILAQQAQHYPITKAIYSLFSALGNGTALASALGVWCMVFLATAVVGAGLILGKKLGALFRV